jgi:hypothetical protein
MCRGTGLAGSGRNTCPERLSRWPVVTGDPQRATVFTRAPAPVLLVVDTGLLQL